MTPEPLAAPDRSAAARAAVAREAAAVEERHWLRLTRRCNNRCLFCHDAERQDGSVLPVAELEADMAAGRARGATRLVLSGGEATIHPAFVELVAAGRRAGYRWIQVVTNGRMFAYERFTRRAAEAGLDEATVSVHGHTPELHDALAGARGAFAQALRGIRNLQAAGRVVSVDVVVCRPNVRHLGDILQLFLGMGVTEFDLLHLIPHGRAETEERERLAYDAVAEAPGLVAALRAADRPGVHLWTNRWPPPLLEGVEHLIQDPHKLLDELRGTAEGFAAWLERGEPLPCRGERCGRCHMEGFCGALEEARTRLLSGGFEVVEVEAARAPAIAPGARAALARQARAVLRLRARDVAEAEAALARLPGGATAGLELELERPGPLPPALAGRVRRAVVRTAAQLDAALDLGGVAVEVPLSRATAPLAARALAEAPERVLLRWPGRALLSEVVAEGLPPAEVARLARDARAEGIARCLAPRSERPRAVLAEAWLRPDGGLDLFPFAERYLREEDRTRALRCAGCPEAGACPGAHVNEVRAHGFGWMRLPGGGA